MSDYEVTPYEGDYRSMKTLKKYNDLMQKKEEMFKMKDQLKNFKESVENIDFLKEDLMEGFGPSSGSGNKELEELMKMEEEMKRCGLNLSSIGNVGRSTEENRRNLNRSVNREGYSS
eukprot:CAMPEP_0170522624 /NCGR_PEP_ID=MMETSP0209-20121228/8046_1 /TAXON_ID=665100 ORGANISM="Litonotus pictus, Strain P1" /NCGR_SAMPLE_ID=MMETSP0209 /ASSEMBLY_ACC=CAM_ASM_000301 /LENGTH=116 /DNA_ID=CAMNT_0010810235 /DNA_START=563 /DNA_END=909 /DNA_ORIENTATION=-